MRILQVIPSTSIHKGGPSVVAVELNRAFWDLGHEALLVTIADRGEDASTILEGRWTLFCRASGPKQLEFSWIMLRTIVRFARHADIIAADSFYGPHVLMAFIASRLFRKPLFIQPHGVFDGRQQTKSRAAKRIFDAFIGSRILDKTTALHFSSEIERTGFASRSSAVPSFVVPHGVGFAHLQPVPAIESWIRSSKAAFIVVFAGRLAEKKQPALLIDSWAASSGRAGAALIFAGPDSDWSADELRQRSRAAGLADTFFSGPLPRAQLGWLLARSDVFVLPSLEENYGLAVPEALSQGCFVITTEAVASSHLVRTSGAGIVLPDATEESLACALTAALSEKVRLPASRQAATEAVEHLSWHSTAAELLDRYAYFAGRQRSTVSGS